MSMYVNMTFAEAMQQVGRDFKVRRPHWAPDTYVSPMWMGPTSMRFEAYFSWAKNHNATKYQPTSDDKEATDWERYEPRSIQQRRHQTGGGGQAKVP